jgi:hypothetical protein
MSIDTFLSLSGLVVGAFAAATLARFVISSYARDVRRVSATVISEAAPVAAVATRRAAVRYAARQAGSPAA